VKCPLCESSSTAVFFEKNEPKRGPLKYYKCQDCYLIFLSPTQQISADEERARYDQHQNNPDNAGYIQSLQKLVTPLSAKLKENSRGLDFGCGPQSALKLLFEQRGHTMEVYDPFYFPDAGLLREKYDFVTCSEVVEHFRHPQKEFVTLHNMLREAGSLIGIMTQFAKDEKDFRDWWYHRDPTHVCFYRKETFQWIGGWRRLFVEFPDDNIVILTK